MTTIEVLDRIASGESIYTFVCANGDDVIKAAKEGAEAVRNMEKVNELIKYWEEDDDR